MSTENNNKSEWVQRNIIDEPRLSELVETYESLGFEVMLKDFDPKEFPQNCDICMTANLEKFKVLFTRKID